MYSVLITSLISTENSMSCSLVSLIWVVKQLPASVLAECISSRQATKNSSPRIISKFALMTSTPYLGDIPLRGNGRDKMKILPAQESSYGPDSTIWVNLRLTTVT